ncbi:MAG: hypothetical protein ABFR50_02185, partial [Candidatus Fermentibacteria bacterium]
MTTVSHQVSPVRRKGYCPDVTGIWNGVYYSISFKQENVLLVNENSMPLKSILRFGPIHCT